MNEIVDIGIQIYVSRYKPTPTVAADGKIVYKSLQLFYKTKDSPVRKTIGWIPPVREIILQKVGNNNLLYKVGNPKKNHDCQKRRYETYLHAIDGLKRTIRNVAFVGCETLTVYKNYSDGYFYLGKTN